MAGGCRNPRIHRSGQHAKPPAAPSNAPKTDPLPALSPPHMVLAIIPFGFIGVIFGHIVMRIDLTLFSLFGLVAQLRTGEGAEHCQ